MGLRRHVDGGGERLREPLEAGFAASGLGQLVELALGVLDVGVRRRVDRRIIGEIDHVLADSDQVAADRKIIDSAAVVFGVDYGRRLGGKPRQVLVKGKADDVEIPRHEGLQRDRRRQFSGADEAGRELENALMDRLEEVLRFKEIGDAVERLVVDEDRAEQRLFGLNVVWRRAEFWLTHRATPGSRLA
jgi:hypothetical protein